MIDTEQKLIDLVNGTYEKPIIEHNKFGELVVRKNQSVACLFSFRDFTTKENQPPSLHDMFVGHKCLVLNFQYYDSSYHGGGRMETCDNQDLSSIIIELIDTHIGLEKKRYEQISLW